jgi:hypothetical protein
LHIIVRSIMIKCMEKYITKFFEIILTWTITHGAKILIILVLAYIINKLKKKFYRKSN